MDAPCRPARSKPSTRRKRRKQSADGNSVEQTAGTVEQNLPTIEGAATIAGEQPNAEKKT